MSEHTDFWHTYNVAISRLGKRQLGGAIDLLHKLVDKSGNWQLLDELEDISSAYKLLLDYMRQGANDPERELQYLRFIARCYVVAEKAARQERIKENGAVKTRDISEILKDLENLGMKNITSQLSDDDMLRHNKLYIELFHCAANEPIWNAERRKQAEQVMNSGLVSNNDKLLMVCGLMLNCLYAFDAQKIMFFADMYRVIEVKQLRLYLLISAVLPLQIYQDRLFAYSELDSRFKLLNDVPHYSEDLAAVQFTLLECLTTKDVNNKLHNEIIPAMLRNSKFDPFNPNINKVIEEHDDSNPAWKELDKAMEELAALEENGADVYYTTLSQLKRNSFFKEEANWFCPFDFQNASLSNAVRKAGGEKGVLNILLNSSMLCDSDKYSLCMLLDHIDNSQMQMLLSQIPSAEEAGSQGEESREVICRNFMRNLFRYFYLYNGSKPSNPFEANVALISNALLRNAMVNAYTLSHISAFAVKHKMYDVAISYLEAYDGKDFANNESYQKLGFCYQKTFHLPEAIKAYEKAYELDDSSKWTIRHLAQAHLKIGNFKEAYNYYNILKLRGDDDKRVTFHCGECLAKLKRYDEALKEFFKLEYLAPDDAAPLRAIAWCYMLMDDTAQALTYYAKLAKTGANSGDYICMGHAYWISGDITSAAGCYQKAAAGVSPKDFSYAFFDGEASLAKHGITHDDMQMMYDLVTIK